MADNEVVAAAVDEEGEQAAGGEAGAGGWAKVMGLACCLVIVHFVMSLASQPSFNMFPKQQEIDLYVYLSEAEGRFTAFDDLTKLFWHEQGLVYGDWTSGPNGDGDVVHSATLPCPPVLQNNGSLFIHVFIVKSGQSPDPSSSRHVKREVIYHSRRLNKYMKKTQNLPTEKGEEEQRKAELMMHEILLSYWHPDLTLNLVDDHSLWQQGMLPAPLDEAVRFNSLSNQYYPIFFFNDYGNLGAEYQPLNDTVKELSLTLTFRPITFFQWQKYAWRGGKQFGWDDDLGLGALIRLFLSDHSPLFVSVLHTLLKCLVVVYDIQFWQSRKSLEGLSVLSVLFSAFSSHIVFLYICDNDTDIVIACSALIGLLIELWKVSKCMNVAVDCANPWFGLIPRVIITDQGSYVESATKQYDQFAFKYLSLMLFPLFAVYVASSSLPMYLEQKGWYSWSLDVLGGFLVKYGFFLLTSQLFINYKLKSVAHLPWRALSCAFIAAIVEYAAAFFFAVPLSAMFLHSGCYSDAILFLLFVGQWSIYGDVPAGVFKCRQCPNRLAFPSAEQLAQHQRRLHGDRQHYRHRCEQCGLQCASPYNLTVHMHTHTGEKPFECRLCAKRWPSKRALTRHELTHAGERAYVCAVCQKTFIRSDHLASHALIHTRETSHCCQHCARPFMRARNCRDHELICLRKK